MPHFTNPDISVSLIHTKKMTINQVKCRVNRQYPLPSQRIIAPEKKLMNRKPLSLGLVKTVILRVGLGLLILGLNIILPSVKRDYCQGWMCLVTLCIPAFLLFHICQKTKQPCWNAACDFVRRKPHRVNSSAYPISSLAA